MTDDILVVDGSPGLCGTTVRHFGKVTSNFKRFFKSPKDFILVMFVGGEDVDPSLYNDSSPRHMCSSCLKRDLFEKTILDHAVKYNIPMVGICRGFQFLNVMAGGRLMHHISGHDGGIIHLLDSGCFKDKPIRVNSFHHQMAILNKNSHLIGWSMDKLSDKYYGKEDSVEEWNGPEVEAAIFPSINACGVQYHPEWSSEKSGLMFFNNMVSRLLRYPMSKSKRFIQFYKGDKKGEHKLRTVRTRFNSTTG